MKRQYSSRNGSAALLMALLCFPVLLFGQFQGGQNQQAKPLAPVTRTYAIKNAQVIQAPGKKLEQANVIVRNGLITAVGKNAPIPPDAIIISGDSLFVYAGFIDGLSHTGVVKPKEDQSRERPKDPGNPAPEVAGITPQNDVRESLSTSEKSIDDLRALGFTAAQVVPYGNMLPGRGAVIQLTGEDVDGMVLAPQSALFSELAGAQRVYPSTVIAVIAKWEELYKKAEQTKSYENLYATNRSGLNRPTSDRILEAFYPVIDKKIPVLFEADRYLDIQRILALQSQLGFNVTLGDVKEGWDAISKIKSAKAKVFLSLDLPEEKKDEKKNGGKKGESKSGDEKKSTDQPTVFQSGEKEALEKRREEFMKQYVAQAATFKQAGVPYGFSTLSVKTSDIRANLRRMIKAGLTEDQALEALTVTPAQILGLSDRMGTVENGKIANLVVSDKPYFDEKSNVRYVFVDGVLFSYEVKKTPKADPNAKVEIVGNWTVTTETPQNKSEQTLTITKEGAQFGGSIYGGRLPEAVKLESVELTGNNLKYSYTVQMGGQSFKVDVDATVENDSFSGTATAGSVGSFPVSGKKDPNKK